MTPAMDMPPKVAQECPHRFLSSKTLLYPGASRLDEQTKLVGLRLSYPYSTGTIEVQALFREMPPMDRVEADWHQEPEFAPAHRFTAVVKQRAKFEDVPDGIDWG